MVAHTCNPGTWQVEAKGLEGKDILGYTGS